MLARLIAKLEDLFVRARDAWADGCARRERKKHERNLRAAREALRRQR